MDAYILGKHDGDLPTHLLSGPGGNRVRAMARLDGPHHDAFYAIEVDDPDGVTVLTESLSDSGLVISQTHVAAVADENKVAAHIVPYVHPSHMPPWECYAFIHAQWVEQIPEILAAILAELGDGTVAAAVDSDGNVLIELGSDDEAAVTAAAAGLADALGGGVAVHTVVGDGIVTG